MNDPGLPELTPEELARRLDNMMASGRNISSPGTADDPRIRIAQSLATARHPEMSPEMSARIQSKMIAAHRQKMSRKRAPRPQYTMVLRWAAVLAAAVIFFSAAAMPAVASSVPGELWYPVKRNLETVEIVIAPSSAARAEVHLTQAERRINEVQVLLQRRLFDADLMIDAHNSLSYYEQSTQALGTISNRDEARAAGVTESIALLLQEAEQMHLVSGDEVVALIPTVIAIPTTPSDIGVPTIVPTPSATLFPTEEPPVTTPAAAVEQAQLPDVQPPLTDEPTLVATMTATYTPEVSGILLSAAMATTQQPIVTMYALENTNVRSQPARNQPIITVLQQGEAVAVIGEDATGKWWHVQLGDSRSGWVAQFLLSLDKPALQPTGSDGSNSGNDNGDNFGCEHPGDYCNAPGQNGDHPPPSSGNGNPGKGNKP